MSYNKVSIINAIGVAFRRLARFGALAALVVTVLSLFGRLYWFLELFTHFRLQLAAAALVMAGISALLRMPRVGALFAVISIVNLSFVVAFVMPGFGDAQAAGSNSIRVMTFNLSARNEDYEALVHTVEKVQPDVIGLVEVQGRWLPALDRLQAMFPYQVVRPENSYFGLALLSRFPLRERTDSPYVHEGLQTAILAEVDLPQVTTTLVVSHVMAPMSPTRAALRDAQLQGVSDFFRDDANRARILIGDLNITPWSPRYGVIESQTDLRNAARQQGYLGTWPTSPALLRIPIDHCLVSEAFAVRQIEAGPDIGSDHLPLIVDLGVIEPGDPSR